MYLREVSSIIFLEKLISRLRIFMRVLIFNENSLFSIFITVARKNAACHILSFSRHCRLKFSSLILHTGSQ